MSGPDRLIALVGDEDDVAKAVKALATELGYAPISFQDPVRELATLANPWVVAGQQPVNVDLDSTRLATQVGRDGWDVTLAKLPELRRLLTELEAACQWVFGPGCWLTPALSQRGRVVVTDLHTQDQARAVRDRGGKLVRLVRDSTSDGADPFVRLGDLTTETDSPRLVGVTTSDEADFDVSISVECGDGSIDVGEVVAYARSLEPAPFAPPIHAWAQPTTPPVFVGR